MTKSKETKSFTIRIKAGDLLDLLGKSKEDEKFKVRLAHLYSDYDPDDELTIELTDKTEQYEDAS